MRFIARAAFAAAVFFHLLAYADAQNKTVSYADVLAAPYDLDLNFNYAQAQVQAGDLEQAAGTLERLLLISPDWDTARLFYAFTLYRLDDLEGAEREFELLSRRALPPVQAAEVRRYLQLSRAGSKQTRLTGSVSVGVGVGRDTWWEPARILQTHDGFLSAGAIRLEHTLRTGHGDFVFAEADIMFNDRWGEPAVSFSRVRAGATFYLGDLAITPTAVYSPDTYDGDLYLAEWGGELELRYAADPRLHLLGQASAFRQDFSTTDADPFGGERDGDLFSVGGGIEFRPTTFVTTRFVASYFEKTAETEALDYEGYSLELSTLLRLGAGQYLRGALKYRHRDFAGPDPGDYRERDRVEDRQIASLAYGVPVTTLSKWVFDATPALFDNVNLQAEVTYERVHSDDRRFNAEGIAGRLLLTKHFAF
jgi:hypothetical protein